MSSEREQDIVERLQKFVHAANGRLMASAHTSASRGSIMIGEVEYRAMMERERLAAAEIDRLRTALAAREGGSEGLSVPELEDCALACEAFGKNAGTMAGDAWQRLADKCSRAARLCTGTET